MYLELLDKANDIIEHYGVEKEYSKLCEECGEYCQAYGKYLITPTADTAKELKEEIADVWVVATQLMEKLDLYDKADFKLNRTLDRIRKEKET